MAQDEPHLEFACVILRRGPEVLIVRPQSEGGERSKWAFPAGPVSEGESAEDACLRMGRDRLGAEIEIQLRQPPLRSRQGVYRILYHYFFGLLTSEEVDNREFAEIRWVRVGQLREYDFDEATQVVVDWLLKNA